MPASDLPKSASFSVGFGAGGVEQERLKSWLTGAPRTPDGVPRRRRLPQLGPLSPLASERLVARSGRPRARRPATPRVDTALRAEQHDVTPDVVRDLLGRVV